MISVTDRLVFTLRFHVVTAFILVHAFMIVINVRLGSSWNPIDPETAAPARIPVQVRIYRFHLYHRCVPDKPIFSQILTNTLEQSAIFFLSTMALSTYLDGKGEMKLIPVLFFVFALGRIAFAYL